MDYAGKLKDSLTWWLGKRKPFIVNNEYSIELLFIDKINNSAKIKVTNLTSGLSETSEVGSYDYAEVGDVSK